MHCQSYSPALGIVIGAFSDCLSVKDATLYPYQWEGLMAVGRAELALVSSPRQRDWVHMCPLKVAVLSTMASNLYIDEEIHVPTLLELPTTALFPVLKELMGWAQV